MARRVIFRKEEIIGILYLTQKIRGEHPKWFDNLSHANIKINEQLGENDEISYPRFRRLFQFGKGPEKLTSYETMDTLVRWFYKKEYMDFEQFLIANNKEITLPTEISEDVFQAIMNTVEALKNKKKTKKKVLKDLEPKTILDIDSSSPTNHFSFVARFERKEQRLEATHEVDNFIVKYAVEVIEKYSSEDGSEKHMFTPFPTDTWILTNPKSSSLEFYVEMIYKIMKKIYPAKKVNLQRQDEEGKTTLKDPDSGAIFIIRKI